MEDHDWNERKQSFSSSTSKAPVSPTLQGVAYEDEDLEKIAEDLLLDPGTSCPPR